RRLPGPQRRGACAAHRAALEGTQGSRAGLRGFRRMTKRPRVLAFAGSLRRASLNKRVLKTAIRGAEAAGAEVTYIDLRDYPMPVYDSDEHEAHGFDENALKLQGLLIEHDGLLIASPEYNGSLPRSEEHTSELQ